MTDDARLVPIETREAAGFTLVELIVVVAVIGVTFTVATLTLSTAFGDPPGTGDWEARLSRARAEAVEGGAPVLVLPDSAHRESAVLFLPDGRAVGSGVDPLDGSIQGVEVIGSSGQEGAG